MDNLTKILIGVAVTVALVGGGLVFLNRGTTPPPPTAPAAVSVAPGPGTTQGNAAPVPGGIDQQQQEALDREAAGGLPVR